MAVRSWTQTSGAGKSYHFIWTGLLNGDTGEPVSIPGAADMTFQVYGTFGVGGTVILQGSCDLTSNTSPTYFTMRDSGDNLVSFTIPDGEAIAPAVALVRPDVTAGDGATNITAVLYVRSTMR